MVCLSVSNRFYERPRSDGSKKMVVKSCTRSLWPPCAHSCAHILVTTTASGPDDRAPYVNQSIKFTFATPIRGVNRQSLRIPNTSHSMLFWATETFVDNICMHLATEDVQAHHVSQVANTCLCVSQNVVSCMSFIRHLLFKSVQV